MTLISAITNIESPENKFNQNRLEHDEFYTLKCVKCGFEYLETQTYTDCMKCRSPLDVTYNYEYIQERLNVHLLKTSPPKALKYLGLYPLTDFRKIITLDEGGTPLYQCKNLGRELGLKNLFIKYEGANPTGAFKDRGSMVELTKAIEMNARSVYVASTGNMAASVSAYSTKAKLPCYVFVPEGTPIGKLSQTLLYGAQVIQIRGSYDDAARLAAQIALENNSYLAGDYAFRLEGQKSEGYEIIEQLNWHSPDKIFVPIGCGTNISAIWKGIKELQLFDLVKDNPQIVGVQAEKCSPVVDAFKDNKDIIPIKKPETVASAIAAGTPLDGIKALQALRESSGLAIKVSDVQILEAEKMLAKQEAIFVEPSAASILAALIGCIEAGQTDKDEIIVLVMTGSGLKDPMSVLHTLPTPPSVDPKLSEISKYLNYEPLKTAQLADVKN